MTVSSGANVTYVLKVCSVQPGRDKPFRARITVYRNLLEYHADVFSTTTSLATFKTLLNNIVFTPNTRFSSIDIKDFCYGMLLANPKYMRILLK